MEGVAGNTFAGHSRADIFCHETCPEEKQCFEEWASLYALATTLNCPALKGQAHDGRR